MALVNVLNVDVLKNPAAFNDPFRFNITFECLSQLEEGSLVLVTSRPQLESGLCWLCRNRAI